MTVKNDETLINRILKAISEHDIQNFLLNTTVTTSEEMFFIKKDCILTRNKLTTKCEVTIYHDFEADEIRYRGSSSFIADLNMKEDELNTKIYSAYQSALSVKNPYYKLPASGSALIASVTNDSSATNRISDINEVSANTIYNAAEIANIIFKNDISKDAFINSVEIFVTSENVHIINSNGINVSYNELTYSGEYVVQATTPTDVELYQDFKYSYLDKNIADSLSDKVSNSLHSIKARAIAVPINTIQNGKLHYKNLILEGSSVYELFHYYLKRLDASMIYPGYSRFKIGESVIPSNNMSDTYPEKDKLNIKLTPKTPYSSEGIRLINAKLIENNIAHYITGNARFSFYLGIPAIGVYESYELACGHTSIEELQSDSYLKIVNFSDFQMDELTGQFGGEFRLGYYFDGKNTIPVTNGSISGNINDIINNIILSKEKQTSYHFTGPLAVAYKNN